ncbi:thiamine pyrophosphate-binding protein [Hoeflea sp. YIM 152468]|uniref:thiamine pyrophosphate-binding protein n=1 Tax=Hoeflea sp. YIM 152468 TaxID=3031759 RepID=UPI0023DBCCFC|nr:thiamine pyrophosphate-binding protein [Hoeflea sp. YIM 152468]MDF1609811.1 thiamine pyrophosphate-binding protein [Hoeflea sp. YIM 152468]
MRGADLLVQTLGLAGVTKIFSLSGNQIMPVYDACLDGGIDIIHTRHEGAAVFMADAWAQLTGEIGVALVTAAPGAANAMGPLFSARQSESPVLLLTGDSPRGQDGKGAFQEFDQVPMTAPLTKLSMRAESAATLGDTIALAIRTALSGRPGPVHVALPFDVVEADCGGASLPSAAAMARDHGGMNDTDLDSIIEMLAAAARPLVLCGPALNATRQGTVLTALQDVLDAPVVAMESPRGLRDPSLGNFARALERADLVISLGKPINFTLGFGATAVAGADCRWIVIDSDAAERARAALNLGDRLALVIDTNPLDAADQLMDACKGAEARRGWRGEVAGLISCRCYDVAAPGADGKITPAQLAAAVQRQIEAANEAVLICDGGEFGQWAQAGTHAAERIINGPSGAIGGGLCYALAARTARPDATVFALMGDGTVGFHLAEFETAARENLPFIVVIGNDACWNAEHQIQLRDYGPDRLIGCQLSGARYDRAVAALGGHGEYVTDLADLDAALGRAVASGKVACVNVVIDGQPAPSGSAH